MRNVDLKNQERAAMLQLGQQLIAEGKNEEGAEKLVQYYEGLAEDLKQEARAIAEGNDQAILTARGVRQLTSVETNYYTELIQALSGKDFKQAVNNLDLQIPETVFNDVFEELRGQYPLLDAIDFQFLPGNVKILMNTGERNKATWGKLCDEIVKEVTAGLKEVKAGQYKLSAFVFICKSMLTLGAPWLDRFVREVLYDSISWGLEDGIVNGTGHDEPIGMIRDLSGSIDPVTGYSAKTEVVLNSFSQADLGPVMKELATGINGNTRVVGEVIFLYNPADWYTSVHPAAHILGPTGYVNVVPFPVKFVPCVSVPIGKAVIGIAKRYFMTVATSEDGQIEFSDHYKFLEDDRTYLIKLLGNGMPKDNKAFAYLDISNIKPFVPAVSVQGVVQTEDVPAG